MVYFRKDIPKIFIRMFSGHRKFIINVSTLKSFIQQILEYYFPHMFTLYIT